MLRPMRTVCSDHEGSNMRNGDMHFDQVGATPNDRASCIPMQVLNAEDTLFMIITIAVSCFELVWCNLCNCQFSCNFAHMLHAYMGNRMTT